MADIPDTSESLLKTLAGDAQHVRWGEFVARYRPMMSAYLQSHFPYLEADDLIQNTMITLVKKLPEYRYVPEETGHFHNYLTGVLRRLALNQLKRDRRRGEILEDYAHEPKPPCDEGENEESSWRESMYEIALEQVLADPTIQSRTKQIFLRTAIDGEKPEAVAASFGLKRNAVDQTKARMIERMRVIIASLEEVDDE